ncbi:MAG: hypothetical protein HC866_19405 [Leptolyngbyaceae cyanobacterium RU_5_1]|nr:hypothetical protein [Leptolyngbyaceae cyanobacterium RU_5_1]
MPLALWLVLSWIAGTAAILGSLMTIASLLLWLVPTERVVLRKASGQEFVASNPWQHRVKLLLFSLAIAIVGLSLLSVTPFPVAKN